MKKIIIIIILFCLSISLLCGCSLFKKKGNDNPDESHVTVSDKDTIIAVMNGTVDLDDMSLEELLDYYDKYLENEDNAFTEGALFDLVFQDNEILDEDSNAEIDFDYSENAQIAQFSDEPWRTDKDFEALDVTAGMTPDEKAEFNSMLSNLNSSDAEGIKTQFEDILHGIEGFEDFEIDIDNPGIDDPDVPAISSEWPDNELGKVVPNPDFPDMIVTASEDSIAAYSSKIDLAKVKSYVAKLKSAGFTENAEENEQTIAGIIIYSFSATNKDGIYVTIQHVNETASLSVTK